MVVETMLLLPLPSDKNKRCTCENPAVTVELHRAGEDKSTRVTVLQIKRILRSLVHELLEALIVQ